MGWVEDLLWCGSVGAGITAWLSLYLGSVGLGIVWISLAALAVFRAIGALRATWQVTPAVNAPEPEPLPDTAPDLPSPAHSSERSSDSFWYEVVSVPSSPSVPSAEPAAASVALLR